MAIPRESMNVTPEQSTSTGRVSSLVSVAQIWSPTWVEFARSISPVSRITTVFVAAVRPTAHLFAHPCQPGTSVPDGESRQQHRQDTHDTPSKQHPRNKPVESRERRETRQAA